MHFRIHSGRSAKKREEDRALAACKLVLDTAGSEIRRRRKANPDLPKSLNLFELVTDPEDFGRTVENLYWVADLVHQKKMALIDDGGDGWPVVNILFSCCFLLFICLFAGVPCPRWQAAQGGRGRGRRPADGQQSDHHEHGGVEGGRPTARASGSSR